MRTELIVAGKEFRDHLTSRRFIVIFTLMILLSAYGIANGLNDYNMLLESYKDMVNYITADPQAQQAVRDYQMLISDAIAKGSSQEEISAMQETLNDYLHPQMPGLTVIFYRFNDYFMIAGVALSGILGFNMISKEREEGSLKLLLSKPIYRDAIINGKTIAAIGIILLIIIATFLITIAMMLFFGIIPTISDIGNLVLSFVNMTLYCLVFLGISVLLSSLVKNTTDSLIIFLIIVLLFYMLIQLSDQVTDIIAGPSPLTEISNSMDTEYSSVISAKNFIETNPEVVDYIKKRQLISEASNIISPLYNYQIVSNAIITNEKPYVTSTSNNPTLFDLLSLTWTNLLSMIIEILTAFSLSYMLFQRKDTI